MNKKNPVHKKNAKDKHLERYYSILEEAKAIHNRKNHDYAGDEDALFNLRMCEKMGVPCFDGTVVRLTDKFCRLMNFCKARVLRVVDEGIEDTLFDVINSAAFAIEFYREERAKKRRR